MIKIKATKQQLIAIANRIMTNGTIQELNKMHGHKWMNVNYEGRQTEIIWASDRGQYWIMSITDKTLGQEFVNAW